MAGAGVLNLEDTVVTQPSPDDGCVSPSSAPLSRKVLDQQIARRRARLVALEAEMIAACEAAAMGAHPGVRATAERERWDRATWRRYLVAAMRLEATYGPRIRRLRQEIGQLERLMALPIAA
jgi:hypothetical protein